MIEPILSKGLKRQLKDIDKRLEFKWHGIKGKWTIIYNYPHKHPQILMIVSRSDNRYRMPDQRDFDHLKYIIYRSKHDQKHWFNEMCQADKDFQKKQDAAEYDEAFQTGLATRRAAQICSRNSGYSSGKTKIPYAPGLTL